MPRIERIKQSIRMLPPLLLVLLASACGGGGGSGGSNNNTQAVAQGNTGGTSAAEVVTQRRTITTSMNVPVLFDTPLRPDNPEVQGNWYLPSRGSLAFLRMPGKAAYLPPLGVQGSEQYRHEYHYPDGRIERTIFTAQIETAQPPQHPSACPSDALADEQFIRLAAHPGIPGQLVGLRRNGLALEALRSEDGGTSWTPGDSLPTSEIDVLAFDPASDGVAQATNDTTSWRSVDGGLRWESAAIPSWETGPELPYYLEGNQILRRPDPGGVPHVMHNSSVALIRLLTDPRNPRRIYLLTADGLYTLFQDDLPGIDPMIENVIIAPVETDFGEPLLDMAVDAGGRVLVAGESSVYCVEGDRPFKDPAAGSQPMITFTEVDGQARVQLSAPEVSEPTELTVWLRATRFVTAQPGVVEDIPSVIQVTTLQPGDDQTLDLPLGYDDTGMYTVGAVMRTAAGIVAHNRETTLADPLTMMASSVDLAVAGVSTAMPDGSFSIQIRLTNEGPYPAEGVKLRLEASGESRIQLPELSESGRCSADAGGVTCRFTGPIAPGAELLTTFTSRPSPGVSTSWHLSVASAGREINNENNFWSSDANLAETSLSISAETLRRRPLQGTEALFRLRVSNDGFAASRPFVDGYLERHQGDPEVDYGDWVVIADDADCVMPAQHCGPGACPAARSHRQHYRCEFREPLLPAESRELTISMKTAVEGERVRSVALVGGGYEMNSRDNLSVAEASLTNEPEPTSPDPEPSGPSCSGFLILITWGACLGW